MSKDKEEGIKPFIMRSNSRNKQTEVALVAIYDFLTYLDMGEPVPVEEILERLTGKKYEDIDFYVKSMVVHAIKDYQDIVRVYEPLLRNWSWDRHNRVEQALLLLAYCRFLYDEEKPGKAVIISSSVDLAKKYLDGKDYAFVNAILDKALTDGQGL